MDKIILNCKDAERLINGYINKTLSSIDTIRLIEHIKTCPACREELTIQYLVSEGLNHLDEIDDYNLMTRLNLKLEKSERDIREKQRKGMIYMAVLILALCFVAVVVFLLLM